MKKVNWFYGITTYISNEKITITPDPYGNKQFDITAPEYIIVKDGENTHNKYAVMKFHYATDYVKQYGITDINSIYNCYTLLWDGFKTAKEAKEYIAEQTN